MSDELKQLIIIINELRDKLDNIVKQKGVKDSEVVAASQILDAVLNEYYRLIKRKTEE